MRGGKLRKRIEIQRYDSSSKDAHGNPIRAWTTYITVWGSIEPRKGDEKFTASDPVSMLPMQIVIRYVAKLSYKDRLVYRPATGVVRIFNIKTIVNVEERNVRQEIEAVEELPNG